MKEHSIAFSGADLKSILAGSKTQRRVVVSPQPPFGCAYVVNGAKSHALCFATMGSPVPGCEIWVPPTSTSSDHRLACPFGSPGDRIRVRENHWIDRRDITLVVMDADGIAVGKKNAFEVPTDPIDTEALRRNQFWRLRSGVLMPRWASRITLKITDVRVERLNEISNQDAISEGVPSTWGEWGGNPPKWALKSISSEYGSPGSHLWDNRTSSENFRLLWECIHGKTEWEQNPWVWVIDFQRATTSA